MYLKLCLFFWKPKQAFQLLVLSCLTVSSTASALGLRLLSNGIGPR